jgi:predicted transcriptional regulator YheO
LKQLLDEMDFLKRFIKNISLHFGENCEVVLHEINNFDSRIIAIENGHVTERSVGESSTHQFFEEYFSKDFYRNPVYINKTDKGRILVSSTTIIEDEHKNVIGAICINYDISDLLIGKNAIEKIIQHKTDKDIKEGYPDDIKGMMNYYIKECEALIGKPPTLMTKEEKLKALEYLDNKGIFLITKSSNRVCEYFNISKYTLYTYLEEIRNK